MKTVHDLTPVEAISLSGDDVERLIQIQHMVNGTSPKAEIKIIKEPDEPNLDCVQVWKVRIGGSELLFVDEVEADKATQLRAYRSGRDWQTHGEYLEKVPNDDISKAMVSISTKESWEANEAKLRIYKKEKERRESELRAINSEIRRSRETELEVLNTIESLKASIREAKRVADTYCTYLDLAKSPSAAMKFLKEKFEDEDIRESQKIVPDAWSVLELPPVDAEGENNED